MKQTADNKVQVLQDPSELSNTEILNALKEGTSFGNERLQLLDVLKQRRYSLQSDTKILSPEGEVIIIAKEKKQSQNASKYLMAWITMCALIYGLSNGFAQLLAYGIPFIFADITPASVWKVYFFGGASLFVIILIVAIIPFTITYFKIFKSLDSRKALVWYYFFGTASLFIELDTLMVGLTKLNLLDFDIRFISWPAIAAWLISALVVRALSKGREEG
jgi:hypothetical protein